MKSVLKKSGVLIAFVTSGIILLAVLVVSAGMDSEVTLLSATTETSDWSKDNAKDKWQTVSMRVTAYCPCKKCCGKYSDGRTANNHKIEEGDAFAAADKSIPFMSELIVPGYNDNKPVKVMDRGGVIKGARLDVFFDTHQKALNWGVKYLDVKLRVRSS
ncbi:MAG: 3D domain-containing protein [Planctomycetes bacterium]|nr:3D domain-containing protein [Planctomycetota bacterium]